MSRNPGDGQGAGAEAPVDLAHEPPFALAHLAVVPASLVVEAAGWSQRLEPRAMQVLVVLARGAPAVIGRGELHRRVWGGRVVGEDAINRAVQTLRRVAADAPPPLPFTIRTIPRVGYRLTVEVPVPAECHAESRPSAAMAVDAPRRARRGRRTALVGAAILAGVGAIAVVRDRAGGDHPPAAAWRITQSATLDDLPPGATDVTLSPDGRRLAYRGRDPGGRERVYVRGVRDGGIGRPVSPATLDARRPAWSADGKGLAFAAYDPGRPCRLYVALPGAPARSIGTCEVTVDPPHLAWSADGRSLMLEDAPGWNAVDRIATVALRDGDRTILTSPPGDSMGDGQPIARGRGLIFRRQYGWGDQGWIARDAATGRERVLWRRRGIAASVAASLPGDVLAIAWTRAGLSGLDLVDADGSVETQPLALGPVSAITAAGTSLLVEADRSESALARGDAGGGPAPVPAPTLATVRGRISGPVALPGGRLRFPVNSAGVARLWERDAAGALRPWGRFSATRIAGLAPSPDGRLTAAMVTGYSGRAIVLFDAAGRPVYRWHPPARSLNPAAWDAAGRRLIVPVLDGAGWRLFALDPFGGSPPRDLAMPGFAVVQGRGPALYGVRAGETTDRRELWRLDGRPRRLPFDLTLLDIVNWCVADGGIWLPDRGDRDHPRLVLRRPDTGRIVRSVAAPGLAGPSSGLAADAAGPVYVKMAREEPEYSLLTLARSTGP